MTRGERQFSGAEVLIQWLLTQMLKWMQGRERPMGKAEKGRAVRKLIPGILKDNSTRA